MPALIVEDGTGVANANTYVSIAAAQAYASLRGSEAFDDTDATQFALIAAMDYLQAINNWLGLTTYTDQTLAWPRVGVYIDGSQISSVTIPTNIKNAQIQLALASAGGLVLMPNIGAFDGSGVKLDKVGPLTTEYFSPGDLGVTIGEVCLPQVDALLYSYRAALWALKVDRG